VVKRTEPNTNPPWALSRTVKPRLEAEAPWRSQSVGATPATAATCDPDATLVEMAGGPYYTEGAPLRSTVSVADSEGTPLVLTGTVYDADCQPVAGATIDVWQALSLLSVRRPTRSIGL
jgi:protocatechuate 3,4-dioxygenase beta subunit